MFAHPGALAWLLLCLLIAPVTCNRLVEVQPHGEDKAEADADNLGRVDTNVDDSDDVEDLEDEELNDMSANQKAVLSIESTLRKIASAAGEAGTAAAPVVVQAVGKFGQNAYKESVHFAGGLIEAASMCKKENQDLVLAAVSQVQSFAGMMAATVAEHWPQVRNGLKSFADASGASIFELFKLLKPVVEAKILTSTTESLHRQFNHIRYQAFEEYPNAEKVVGALIKFSSYVATLSVFVAKSANDFVHREDVQHYLKYIKDVAGQLASVALAKSKATLVVFADFAKKKIQELGGQALKAMCDPQVRKQARDATALLIRNAGKLASAIKSQASTVTHSIPEMADVAHTKIAILISQLFKQVPSPSREELLKKLGELRDRTQQIMSNTQELPKHAKKLLSSAMNLLRLVPRVPGFGKNVPFVEADANEDCRWTNFLLRPVNMKGQRRTVEETIDACQQRCAGVEGCEFYSYWPNGGCHLQSDDAKDSLRHATDVIAGPRVCEKK